MKQAICHTLLLALVAIVLLSCSSKKDLATRVDTSKLEKAFLSADSNTQSNVHILVLAIKANNYVDSVFLLRRFTADPSLTPEQKEIVKNLMYTVQAILAEAADKGDTNAQKAVEEYQRRTRGAPLQ